MNSPLLTCTIYMLASLLNEEKVVVVLGTAFGDSGEGYLRISYAYSLDDLKEAIRRIESFIKKQL